MAENTSSYTLNLDAEQFTAAANQAANALTSIGEAGESLNVLVETLEHVGLVAGTIAVAFYSIKGVIDSVFDAEKIKQVASQFNTLSQAAGVYGDTLKRGLVDASQGWATETDLMQHANRAMAELSVGVDRLPELMNAAKNATAVMGGDFLQNFDGMAQAVATGNTRMLRHLGIVIDQKKAYEDYAKSIGTTVDSLSQAGKQEAMLNAVLEQTNQKFSQANTDIIKNTSLWQQAKATFNEIFEIISLLIEKLAGSTLAKFFTSIRDGAQSVKQGLVDAFGTGVERAESLEKKIEKANEALGRMRAKQKEAMSPEDAHLLQQAIDDTTKSLHNYEAQLNVIKTTDKGYLEQEKQRHAAEMAMSDQKTAKSRVDVAAQAKQQAEFNKEIQAMDRETLSIKQQNTRTAIQYNEDVGRSEKLEEEQRLQNVRQIEMQITQVKIQQEAIRAKAAQGHITEQQKLAEIQRTDQKIVELNKAKDNAMIRDDAALERQQQQALDTYVRNSDNAFQGVGRSFAAMSQKNKMAMSDWGQFGQMTTDAFAQHSVSSIQQWAQGHEKGTEAVKGMFAGMAGDMATKYGTLMLLASIWPPSPVGLAGGAALIALGAKLSAMAGNASMGSTSIGTGGAGVSAYGGSMSNPTSSTPLPSQTVDQTQQAQSGVHITVQGSIFDTQATQTRIADLVRNAQDSTDFSVAKVGGGV